MMEFTRKEARVVRILFFILFCSTLSVGKSCTVIYATGSCFSSILRQALLAIDNKIVLEHHNFCSYVLHIKFKYMSVSR